MVNGRIVSASSRVHRTLTSSEAGSSQLDRHPHSHRASRWAKAVDVAAIRLAALPSCWKKTKEYGEGNSRETLNQCIDRSIVDVLHHVRFHVVSAPAYSCGIEQSLNLAI